MLEGLGYEPKKLSKGFLVVESQESWTYNIQVVISPDGSKIGINANLGAVDDPDSITAARWLKLLKDNGDIDPSCFYFDGDAKKLYLHRSFDNRTVTPAYVHQQLTNFCANVKSTSDDWNFVK